MDGSGNLYGTTHYGGAFPFGTVTAARFSRCQLSPSLSISGFPARRRRRHKRHYYGHGPERPTAPPTPLTQAQSISQQRRSSPSATDYTFTAADKGVHTFHLTLDDGRQPVDYGHGHREQFFPRRRNGNLVIAAKPGGSALAMCRRARLPAPPSRWRSPRMTPIGNTATGYTGILHFTSSDGSANLPATAH